MTTEEIQQDIVSAKENIQQLDGLTSTSKVSIWRLFIYIVSFVASTHKKLQGVHMQEVDAKIDTQHFSSEKKLQDLLFNFRYGHLFDRESLVYIGEYTEDQIAEAKIIKRASVGNIIRDGRKILRLKLAKLENGKLTRVPANEMLVVEEYMDLNTPAGTNIEFYTADPDRLRLFIDVYYDPLILDENGELLDASAPAPVPVAIKNFLSSENFDFNGELRVSELEDVVQAVTGVVNRSAKIRSAQYSTQIPANWQEIDEAHVAVSGGFEINDEDLTINYIAKYVR